MVENVAEGLVDLAKGSGGPRNCTQPSLPKAEYVQVTYDTVWDALHAQPVFGFTDRYRVEGTVRRFNELGFAVDEVSL